MARDGDSGDRHDLPYVLEPLPPAETAAWIGLLQAHAKLIADLDADLAEHHGIGLRDFEVLSRIGLAPEGRLKMSELAREVLLSSSRTTRVVDGLQRRGLVHRCACEADQRAVLVALTGEGAILLGQAQRTHFDGVHRRLLEPIGPSGVAALAELWPRVLGGPVEVGPSAARMGASAPRAAPA